MKICSVCQHCYEDTVAFCVQLNHGNLITLRQGNCLVAGKYRLDVLLERSVTSETYQATNLASDNSSIVSLVILNLGKADLQLRERVNSQIQAVAGIDHPNISKVNDYGVLENNDFYIATDFISGQTLASYLENTGSLTEATAVTIARQIAEGLDAAHSAGVVHRSINPSNLIIIRNEHGYPTVKIQNFDFGGLRQQVITEDILEAELYLNALPYLSPEQCVRKITDTRTDIYSLGVVFYEMLSGASPFDAPTPKEIVHKQMLEQPPLLNNLRFDVKALLTHTLMRSLNKSPALRPQTAVGFARNLRHLEYITKQSSAFLPKRTLAASAINGTAFAAENTLAVEEIDNSLAERDHLLLSPFVKPVVATDSVMPSHEEIVAEKPDIKAAPILNSAQISVQHEPNVAPSLSESISVKRKNVETIPFTPESVVFKRRKADFVSSGSKTIVLSSRANPNEKLSWLRARNSAGSSTGANLPLQKFIAAKRTSAISAALIVLLAISTVLGAFFVNRKVQQPQTEQSTAAIDSVPVSSVPASDKLNATVDGDAITINASNPLKVEVATVEKQSAAISERDQKSLSREEANNIKAKINGASKDESAVEKSQPVAIAKIDQSLPQRQAEQDDSHTELNTSLNKWVDATNAGDVDQQMSYYAPRVGAYYLARNASQEAVRAEKQRVFKNAAAVDIQASKPEIEISDDGQSAKMRFRKKYVIKKGQQNRSGEVLQELQWVKSRTGWKIVSERDLKVINNR